MKKKISRLTLIIIIYKKFSNTNQILYENIYIYIYTLRYVCVKAY